MNWQYDYLHIWFKTTYNISFKKEKYDKKNQQIEKFRNIFSDKTAFTTAPICAKYSV